MSKLNAISNQSLLLLRSEELFTQGTWAFINPLDAAVFRNVENPKLIGLHQYHHHFSECERSCSQKQFFGAAFGEDVYAKDTVVQELKPNDVIEKHSLDGVVIYMPKSKQQLAMLINNASYLVKPNGTLLLVGENKAGIKSAPKLLEKIGTQVNKIDSAKHCGLYAVTVTKPQANFKIDDYSIVHEYQINQQSMQIYSLPGVFGHKQLDPGTDLLLQQLTPESLAKNKTRGHVYDFACGTGIIGCYLAKVITKTKHVTMSDISALATYCSEQTARLNEVEVNVISCSGVAQCDTKFDVIVSNPPFHEGIQQDYSITDSFIKQAFSRSHQYASITLVANRFLPYPGILDTVYKGFTEVAVSNKYRVYGAKKFAKS
ncbi:MAG: 16S rRNA (guanine1207-N2)-methyltransferase [Alphaproteobacteria bacterium]|jgi:16S rRNA (guanine1207-N2)-methyltransferase